MTPFAEDVLEAADGVISEEGIAEFKAMTFYDFNLRSHELELRAFDILQGSKNKLTHALPTGQYWLEISVMGGTKRVAFVVTSAGDMMTAWMIHSVNNGPVGQHPTPVMIYPSEHIAFLRFFGESHLEERPTVELLALLAATLEAALERIEETVH